MLPHKVAVSPQPTSYCLVVFSPNAQDWIWSLVFWFYSLAEDSQWLLARIAQVECRILSHNQVYVHMIAWISCLCVCNDSWHGTAGYYSCLYASGSLGCARSMLTNASRPLLYLFSHTLKLLMHFLSDPMSCIYCLYRPCKGERIVDYLLLLEYAWLWAFLSNLDNLLHIRLQYDVKNLLRAGVR